MHMQHMDKLENMSVGTCNYNWLKKSQMHEVVHFQVEMLISGLLRC